MRNIFADVQKIEPQTPVPALVTAAPPDPFLAVNDKSMEPKFAAEPLPRIAALPTERPKAVIGQETPKESLASDSLPQFAEVKRADPLPRAAVLPVERPKAVVAQEIPKEDRAGVPPLQIAEVKPLPIQQPVPLRESLARPIPAPDEPTGFASSRKTTQKVELSEDQSIGFARSRK